MITTVLIDYDGTLHDWDTVLKRSLHGILGLTGQQLYDTWTYDIHRAIVHTRHMEKHDDMKFHCRLLFQHLNRPHDEETTELICRKFEEAGQKAKDDPIYFTDAIPALDELRKMGLKLCLSTGTNAEDKAETLTQTTGTDHFDHVFSEPAIGCFKTEPQYYRTALKRAGSEPHETVSIGDTPLSDIRPAKLVGIHTIWLNRDHEPRPPTEDQTADHEAEDLLQAVQIIHRMRRTEESPG
jgi:HAD superfamily hydrolase (TIGR01509 family)